MKKYFSSEALFVLMLIMCFNSLLFAQSKFLKLDASKMHYELTKITNTENSSFIKLPLPSGKNMNFKIKENNTITGEYKKEFPGILSFDIVSTEDPSYFGALTINKEKLYATIHSKEGLIGIWPSNIGDKDDYKVYLGTNDPESGIEPLTCIQDHSSEIRRGSSSHIQKITSRSSGNNGEILKTYRLVIVCTGEFYEANGNSAGTVNSLITAIVNGWNVILKNDLAIELVLARAPYLYTNKNTDPFIPDGDGGNSRVTQAVDAIHSRFNSSLYDIGHVMHNHSSNLDPDQKWANGGLAGLGVVCSNSTYFGTTGGPDKAAGWSGAYNNDGNGYIQLSVHEVGHQFDMTHTFNGTGGACTDNITDYTSYEIGSGTTIMSYSSSCDAEQNIPESGVLDNYYHVNSIERALNYINNEASCETQSATGNTPPIANAGSDYIIPKNTPFVLKGDAMDADGDLITYCWEQYDEDGNGTPTQGKIGSRAASDKLAPLFRSYPPTENPFRYFPHMNYILDGQNRNQSFEALSSVGRTINFRLTVRDNNPSGGGVSWDETVITVANNSTTFQVNSHNSANTLNANGVNTMNIVWSVGKTDESPINCAEVDIYFSTDGGKSFPYHLGTLDNDGGATVLVPNLPTVQGRYMVKAKNNIFFDVNNADITITSECEAIGTSFIPDEDVEGSDDGEIDENLDLSLEPVFGDMITKFSGSIIPTDLASNLVYIDLSDNSCRTAGNDVYYDIYKFYASKSGYYRFQLTGANYLVMNIYEDDFDKSNLCNNMIASNATKNVGENNVSISSVIEVSNLVAGKPYYFRISNFSPTVPDLPAYYSISALNKPTGSALYDDIIPPGNDYTYRFIAYNSETDNIAQVDESSDYRFLNSGKYYVRGISIQNLDLPLLLNFVDQPFDDLLTDIIESNICANLSANTIMVTIHGAACPIGDSGITDLTCNDNETNMLPDDDFISFSLNPIDNSNFDTYTLNLPDGYTSTPMTANFDEVTDFVLNQGSAGQGDISAKILYGDDCEFEFIITDPGSCSDCVNANARINEFHYDNKSGDENEFLEVYIENPQPDSLYKYIVALYNGNNKRLYDEETLDNMTATVGNDGVYYVWEPNSIQNGSPDGIALIGECGDLLEFLSYEGSFTAEDSYANGFTSTDIMAFEGKNTPLDGSLQLIDDIWVQTIAYNTKGLANDLGPCIIADVELFDITCNDNDTPANPTDDFLSFKMVPIANQLGEMYSLSSDAGSINPTSASASDTILFTLFSGSAGNGDINITIKSTNDETCTYIFTIADPGNCSSDCVINEGGLKNINCYDNETPNYAGDDQIVFELDPAGYNNSSYYSVSLDSGSVEPNVADYGSSTEFKLFNGSAGIGDLTITLKDGENSSCEFEVQITDPGVCSTSSVSDFENEHIVSIYPNPANKMLYIKSENSKITAIKIVDLLGKTIVDKPYNEKLDISILKQSTYFILFYNIKHELIDAHQLFKY